jgi:hypothetical protein
MPTILAGLGTGLLGGFCRSEDGVEPGEGPGVVEGACAGLAVVPGSLGGGEGYELARAAQRCRELWGAVADVVAFGVADEGRAGDLLGVVGQ